MGSRNCCCHSFAACTVVVTVAVCFIRQMIELKKKFQHTDTSNLKRFEQIELSAKLLNYFLGSNKSNINQSMSVFCWLSTRTKSSLQMVQNYFHGDEVAALFKLHRRACVGLCILFCSECGVH